jgi:segregation and condensation protein B
MVIDPALLTRIVQAALLASPQPVTVTALLALFDDQDAVGRADIEQAITQLRLRGAGDGVELVNVASGWRYQVRGDVHPWVSRLWSERRTRYSRATLETLALIAYRQPVTRGEIEQVRGVTVASSIIQTLEERGWISVVGHREVPGRPALLGTTAAFLDHFGLARLDQLPPLNTLEGMAGLLDPALSDDSPIQTTPLGAPEAAPGVRAADASTCEFNAVAMTTVAVEQADSEPEGRPTMAGRSHIDE